MDNRELVKIFFPGNNMLLTGSAEFDMFVMAEKSLSNIYTVIFPLFQSFRKAFYIENGYIT